MTSQPASSYLRIWPLLGLLTLAVTLFLLPVILTKTIAMANLPETGGYAAGITQIETTDPVMGGPGGKANEQATQLAARTKYLRDRIPAHVAAFNAADVALPNDAWVQVGGNLAVPAAGFDRKFLFNVIFEVLVDAGGYDGVIEIGIGESVADPSFLAKVAILPENVGSGPHHFTIHALVGANLAKTFRCVAKASGTNGTNLRIPAAHCSVQALGFAIE